MFEHIKVDITWSEMLIAARFVYSFLLIAFLILKTVDATNLNYCKYTLKNALRCICYLTEDINDI